MIEKHPASDAKQAGGEALVTLQNTVAAGRETTRGVGSPSFAPGERVADRYRIKQLLGRGGMGEVYEAQDDELSIPVALKALRFDLARDRRALWRLKQEVLLARAVAHPHVCRVYDLGRHRAEGDDVVWFLTMELLRGETLRERLRRQGRLPVAEALPWVEQMAAGLGAAHRAGVMHLDFKSGNVMLVGEGEEERAVVTDFGLARTVGARDEQAGESKRTEFVGTPEYMAPEQVRGQEAGPPADIYALGVVVYEMVTGRLPFVGKTPLEGAVRRLDEEPPSPRSVVVELDERWEEVILRCLAREAGARFGRVEEVAEALSGRMQVAAPGALGTVPRVWQTLPAERDAFIGREAELEELGERIERGTRLVTLLGAGGMGKTRLAVRYGWQSLINWPGGVWFCDLTNAQSVNGIVSAVAGSLGVSLSKGDPVEQLGHAIAGRGQCLMILDNFEQVTGHAGETIHRWLERARDARFVVTSRERLNVRGEEVQAVEPLGPESGVDLFVERARRQRPTFEPQEASAEAEAVREVVRLAEGMPLAIELAAARVRVMTAAQLVERMRERFRLLGGAGGGRHASLKAAIDGSWELMQEWEQAAWAQCAVFEGGFTLEAAEGVVDLTAWPEAPWVVDVMQSLVDKSLLRTWVPEIAPRGMPEARFGMYVSLQEYARMKLGEEDAIASRASGAAAVRAAEERHGRWYAPYGTEEVIEALERDGGVERRQRMEPELENLMSACRRAVARGDGGTAVAAYRASWAVLELRGPFGTAVELGRVVLADPRLGREARANVLGALAQAERLSGRMDEARAHCEAALAIHREMGNRRSEGVILGNLGNIYREQGRMEEAHAHCQAALAIHREVGDRRSEGVMLGYLGNIHREQGRMEEARAHFEAALAIDRGVGNRRFEGFVIVNLGTLHHEQGRMQEARRNYEAALVIAREVGDRRLEGIVLGDLAILDQDQGRIEEARAQYEAVLAIHREVGDRRVEGILLSHLGNLESDRGQIEEARDHYEAALAIHREVGDRLSEGGVLGSLGNVLQRQGRIDRARDALTKGEAILRHVGEPTELGKLLCARAELEHGSGNAGAARATLGEAEALATQIGSGPDSELGRMLAKLRQTLAVQR